MVRPEGICYTLDDGDTWVKLPDDTGGVHEFLGIPGRNERTGKRLPQFFAKVIPADPLKGEYLLPEVTDRLVKEGRAKVRVLPTHDKWCGVTYQADKEDVKNILQAKRKTRKIRKKSGNSKPQPYGIKAYKKTTQMCMAQDQWSLRFFDIQYIEVWYFFVAQGVCRPEVSGVSEKVHRMCCCAAAVCGSQGHMMRLLDLSSALLWWTLMTE